MHNAVLISKQASKYNETIPECGLVIFNYQNMIVLELTTGAGNTTWDDFTNPVRYFFSDGRNISHKQLLTAALIYGMKRAGVMAPDGELPFITYVWTLKSCVWVQLETNLYMDGVTSTDL
jgi:hypothetical protein